MALKWLICLFGTPYLIGKRFVEDQKETFKLKKKKKKKEKKNTFQKNIGLHLQILLTTIYLVVNTNGRTYMSSEETNTHALSIITTSSICIF
jgi:hypothetical protein